MDIEHIFKFDDLQDLEGFLLIQDIEGCRDELIRIFVSLCQYRDIKEWNQAVRVCESLAIVGWGDIEPVEATKWVYYNGQPNTAFFNKFGEHRYLSASWSIRSGMYSQTLGESSYGWGPCLPDRESQITDYPAEERPLDLKFKTQRNWIPRNPVLLRRTVANCYPNSEAFANDVWNNLGKRLDNGMRPEKYGRDLKAVVFKILMSYEWCNHIIASDSIKTNITAHLLNELHKIYSEKEVKEHYYDLVHRFNYKGFRSNVFTVEICLEKQFSDLPLRGQKTTICDYLIDAMDTVVEKLRKKKLRYDLELMRQDFKTIVRDWSSAETIDIQQA
jgi:hypothetical protein